MKLNGTQQQNSTSYNLGNTQKHVTMLLTK